MQTTSEHADPPGGSTLNAATFDRIAQFITRELGIKMSPDKLPMLQGRLQRRVRTLDLPSLDAYAAHLFTSPNAQQELVEFIDAVTTNKTDFFREPEHFEYLTRIALPNLDPGRPPEWSSTPGAATLADTLFFRRAARSPWSFKLWCAGCSSGEEAYSLAMVLAEFALRRSDFEFAILATDVSTKVLRHAATAIYDEERIRPVALPLRQKYLLRSREPRGGQVRIVPSLRRHVHWHRLNFMDDPYPVRDQFQVIFFRNVMIYFSKETQEKVIGRLARHLAPGGYLFVGHSESLTGLRIPVLPAGTAVYRKPS